MIEKHRLKGRAVAASPGIAISRVQKLVSGRTPIPEYNLSPDQVNKEVERLRIAVGSSLSQLKAQRASLLGMESKDPVHILDAHSMLLLDPQLTGEAEDLIRDRHVNAEWAIRQRLDDIEAMFDSIEDEYLRSKKSDVEQVGQRILDNLTGNSSFQAEEHGKDVILVSSEFTPSQAVQMWQQKIGGFISEQGGTNSHTIIVARGVGLPALVGAAEIMEAANDGDTIIIDGYQGEWLINPPADVLARYKKIAQDNAVIQQGLRAFSDKPSMTADGHHLPLLANMEFIEELPLALDVGAEGMGLYRTEFLYLNRDDLPGEEEQYEHYRQIVNGMQGKRVTFRTLDIGGDKEADFQRIAGQRWGGNNPAMGLRGIRLMLCCEDILCTQIRALLRAAEIGPLSILLPMVTQVSEVKRVRELIEQCQEETGIKQDVQLGTMIEVPAAALTADQLAKCSDFFSIGTNDLIQYTMAADRGDERIAQLNDPGHEAVLMLLRLTVDAAKKANIPVAMCGEMAADPAWTETLLNMGFDALSMSSSRILEIRKHLASLYYRPIAAGQNVTRLR